MQVKGFITLIAQPMLTVHFFNKSNISIRKKHRKITQDTLNEPQKIPRLEQQQESRIYERQINNLYLVFITQTTCMLQNALISTPYNQRKAYQAVCASVHNIYLSLFKVNSETTFFLSGQNEDKQCQMLKFHLNTISQYIYWKC